MDLGNYSWRKAFARGAAASRNGTFDTAHDLRERQERAHAYLRVKGVVDFSFDYDFSNVLLKRKVITS